MKTRDETTPDGRTSLLLWLGMLAGPLYLIVGYSQALLREGFDIRHHALSMLANGDLGWIQTTNFLLSGFLVIAGAMGIRAAWRGSRMGKWFPALLTIYGVGLLGAAVFAADPGMGFPPGAPEPTGMSRAGLLHFVFGGLGFYALIAACIITAFRFYRAGDVAWAVYSGLSGVLFLVSFAAIASGANSPQVILGFYAAVTWIWIWHAAVHVKVLKTMSNSTADADRVTAAVANA